MPLTNIITLRQRSRRLSADLETPISLFLSLTHQETPGLLPERAEVDGRWGRSSIIACDYLMTLSCEEAKHSLDINDTRLSPLKKLEGMPYEVPPMTLNPEDYGISACLPEELSEHTKTEAVSVLQDILTGQGKKAMMDMVTLNEGVALYLLEEHSELPVCMAKAREAVCAGVGRRVLHAA